MNKNAKTLITVGILEVVFIGLVLWRNKPTDKTISGSLSSNTIDNTDNQNSSFIENLRQRNYEPS